MGASIKARKSLGDICSKVGMKKFVANLMSKKNRHGQPLSAKRIQNVMIPLRVIVQDVVDEFGWSELPDPFAGLKPPKIRMIRIRPFGFEKWKNFMEHMPRW